LLSLLSWSIAHLIIMLLFDELIADSLLHDKHLWGSDHEHCQSRAASASTVSKQWQERFLFCRARKTSGSTQLPLLYDDVEQRKHCFCPVSQPRRMLYG
jgi:hypothetical protein